MEKCSPLESDLTTINIDIEIRHQHLVTKGKHIDVPAN